MFYSTIYNLHNQRYKCTVHTMKKCCEYGFEESSSFRWKARRVVGPIFTNIILFFFFLNLSVSFHKHSIILGILENTPLRDRNREKRLWIDIEVISRNVPCAHAITPPSANANQPALSSGRARFSSLLQEALSESFSTVPELVMRSHSSW